MAPKIVRLELGHQRSRRPSGPAPRERSLDLRDTRKPRGIQRRCRPRVCAHPAQHSLWLTIWLVGRVSLATGRSTGGGHPGPSRIRTRYPHGRYRPGAFPRKELCASRAGLRAKQRGWRASWGTALGRRLLLAQGQRRASVRMLWQRSLLLLPCTKFSPVRPLRVSSTDPGERPLPWQPHRRLAAAQLQHALWRFRHRRPSKRQRPPIKS